MDIIFVRGLQIETTIGIYDWERVIKQVVIMDLELGTDIRKAAVSECIADTLDYKELSTRVIRFVEGSQFLLVETLAERVAALLMHEFSIPWLRLTLNKKGAIGPDSDVGIVIERGSRPLRP